MNDLVASVPPGSRDANPCVTVICVTHNSEHVLPMLLESLSSAQAHRDLECVFVDNASSDRSCALVAESRVRHHLIKNSQNRGFASAVNQGVAATLSPFLLLSNPDVNFGVEVIERLSTTLQQHPNAAAVCPSLRYPDGAAQHSIRRFPTHSNIWFSRHSPLWFLSRMIPHGMKYTLPDPPKPDCVDAVSATFMLCRRSAFDEVGGMDERYFLYVEDTDLCKRWNDRGYEVWIDPDARVTHRWQQGSARSRTLARLHRDSIRHYFSIHHADKPVRNAMLHGALKLAGAFDVFLLHRDKDN